MDYERRLRVLRAIQLAVEEKMDNDKARQQSRERGDPVRVMPRQIHVAQIPGLARQYGRQFGVTANEVKRVMAMTVSEVLDVDEG